MKLNDQQFISALRGALHHIYEPDMLRRNPLVEFFGLAGRVDSSLALQELLLHSIDALKPKEEDNGQTNAWRAYDLLFFRYVRGYERLEVANQLGISDRQLSREQRTALETLAHSLLKVHPLSAKMGASNGAVLAAALSDLAPPATETQPGASDWLDNLPADNPTAWKPVFQSAIDLLQPLSLKNGVRLEYSPIDGLPDLFIPQNAFRHSLLNILSALIPLARQAVLQIDVHVDSGLLKVAFSVQRASGKISASADTASRPYAQTPRAAIQIEDAPGLEVAKNLLENAGGTIEVGQKADQLVCGFTIPALAQVPVLVMDDNPDIIQLFQRYGQGTRYSILGASTPDEFFRALDTHHPRIILLDLMMPDMDGWDFLIQLRQNAQTRKAAIILCSILPQKSLALSLGADDFLQKPVLPQDFLHALGAAFDRLQSDESSLHPKESDE